MSTKDLDLQNAMQLIALRAYLRIHGNPSRTFAGVGRLDTVQPGPLPGQAPVRPGGNNMGDGGVLGTDGWIRPEHPGSLDEKYQPDRPQPHPDPDPKHYRAEQVKPKLQGRQATGTFE